MRGKKGLTFEELLEASLRSCGMQPCGKPATGMTTATLRDGRGVFIGTCDDHAFLSRGRGR